MDWVEVTGAIDKLSSMILESGFQPGLLIAVARGGWIPTHLLSSKIDHHKIASIGISYEDNTRDSLFIYSFPKPIVQDQKLLVIEDMIKSGRSLAKAVDELEKFGAIVRSASLFVQKNSIFIPDYYISTVNNRIIFPWEDF